MDPPVYSDGLLGIIAAITAGERSGRLQIIAPGTRGAFFFKDGKLVDVRMGPFSGFPAVNLAVSLREPKLDFDSSIQPPSTSTLITINERVLLKERFGIETSDLPAVDHQGPMLERAEPPIPVPNEVALPESGPATGVSEQLSANANSPALNNRRVIRVQESRRRAANRVTRRQKIKPLVTASEVWNPPAEEFGANATDDQSFATFIPEGEKPPETSPPAKRVEQSSDELVGNSSVESYAEFAGPRDVISPTITRESAAVEIRDRAQIKRCPKCNRAYEAVRTFCFYDSTELITPNETSSPVGPEPRSAGRRILFLTVASFTFLVSGAGSYWLNSYFSTKPGAGTQTKVEAIQPEKVDEEQPVIEGDLRGKEVRLVLPEYPASAKSKGLTGKVTVSVLVNQKGVVVSARALNGDHLLRSAAVSAARKTKFSSEKLVGEKSRISGTITYSFK